MRNLLVLALLAVTACSWELPTAPGSDAPGKTAYAQLPAGRRRAAGPGDVVAQPQCANPAPLELAKYPAPGYIVVLDPTRQGLSANQLQEKYAVAVRWFYDFPPGFSGEMSAQAVAGLRCEPNVQVVAQNAYGRVTNARP
ncbi:MAG: hypothetical protein ACXW3E_14545 [Thermoanaerobaculia bacterium]